MSALPQALAFGNMGVRLAASRPESLRQEVFAVFEQFTHFLPEMSLFLRCGYSGLTALTIEHLKKPASPREKLSEI